MHNFGKLLLLWLFVGAYSDEHNHIYEDNEEVVLWMNTVGPYHNRQETYAYYSLPFCVGSKETISHYHETRSEALQGLELEVSGIEIEFKSDMKKAEYCAVQLNEEKYKAFVYAVKNHYWYQMYIDDLPLWGVVGEVKDNSYYIWTHKKFEIGYNGKQIIDVNLTSEDKVLLSPHAKLSFTYEVTWKKTDTKYEDRFDKYLDHNFFQHRVKTTFVFFSVK